MGWRWIVFSVLGAVYVSGCVSGPGNQAVPGADAMPGLEETGPVEPDATAAPAPSTRSVDCDANAGNLSCDAPNGPPFHFWQDCAIHPLTFEADSAVVREKIGNPEYQPEGLTPTTTSILVWAGTCRSMVLGHETVVLGADFWTAKANVLVNDTLASPDPPATRTRSKYSLRTRESYPLSKPTASRRQGATSKWVGRRPVPAVV